MTEKNVNCSLNYFLKEARSIRQSPARFRRSENNRESGRGRQESPESKCEHNTLWRVDH
jgi:hypothetical protein